MREIDIEDAKANLEALVDGAAAGDPFVITLAGKPLVKVAACDDRARPSARRIGFLAGSIAVPEKFDSLGWGDIEQMFGTAGAPEQPR
jgi:prevent-host-death family protein